VGPRKEKLFLSTLLNVLQNEEKNIFLTLCLLGLFSTAVAFYFSVRHNFMTSETMLKINGRTVLYNGGMEFSRFQMSHSSDAEILSQLLPESAPKLGLYFIVDDMYFYPAFLPASTSLYLDGWFISPDGKIVKYYSSKEIIPLAYCMFKK
jgi:hypothetical protein